MTLKLAGLMGLMMVGGYVQAAGFALIEQNASGLGNAYAGQAAVAEDASTIFFNPAGLTEIKGREVVIAGHYIRPSAKFYGYSTLLPVPGPADDAGEPAWVGNFYYAMDITPTLKFGLGVNSPFGLATEYEVPWAGMTQAVTSDVKTLNVNPSLAWKASESLSLGVGVNWQSIWATLAQAAPVVVDGALLGFVPATMKGHDYGNWGWNAGILFKPDASTRVGLSYRSQVEHELEGTLATTVIVPVTAAITLPDMASLSLFRRLNERFDVLADVTWTGWSSFDKLDVRLAALPTVSVSTVDESWEDVWRYSLGLNYHPNENWTWRFGVAFDETPVPDAAHRTPRIPDEDRTWVAVGAQYKLSERSRLDFGYAHLFVKDAAINHCEHPWGTTCESPLAVVLTGNYDNKVDILSVQFSHAF